MKRVFVVHMWSGNPEGNWYPWLKKELEAKGFEVNVPEMPDTDEPKIGAWVSYLKKIVGTVNEDTYFVGHSVGCQTILRYLEQCSSKEKIGGAVFVAGWFKLENLESEEEWKIMKPWLETSIEYQKIRILGGSNKFTAILSDNDPFVSVKENEDMFKNQLGAKVIIKNNLGHFTKDDGVAKLPVALEELLKMMA